MPARKRTTKKRRPRKYTRRTARKKWSPTSGAVTIFPHSKVAKLRYCTNYTLDSIYGAISHDYVNVSNPYAPESSGGHQPLGWDQYASYYNHAIVLGAKVSFKVLDYTTGQGGPAVIGSYISDGSTAPFTTYTTFVENRRGPYRILTNQRNVVSWSTKFSTKRFFNVTDVKDNFSRLGISTAGTGPTDAAHCFLFYQCLNSTDASSVVIVQITIDYIIAFSEPKDVPTS